MRHRCTDFLAVLRPTHPRSLRSARLLVKTSWKSRQTCNRGHPKLLSIHIRLFGLKNTCRLLLWAGRSHFSPISTTPWSWSPFLETDQVDDLFVHTRIYDRCEGDFRDLDWVVEKVKLLCALRATRVHLEAAARMKRLETLEPRNVSGSSPLMANLDVKQWSVEEVSAWLDSVPVLKHLSRHF